MALKNKIRKIKYLVFDLIPLRKSIILGKWHSERQCSPPSPHFVKQGLLLRHGTKGSTWIETGTHLGKTTKLIAKNFAGIHTIEPSPHFQAIAREIIGSLSNVTFYNGTSEECLESACTAVNGDVCFWLDGHHSGGLTFKGNSATPIIYELTTIEKFLSNYKTAAVFVDDVRHSHQNPLDYPCLNYYVEWANRNNLNWTIEHDVFIAKSKDLNVCP